MSPVTSLHFLPEANIVSTTYTSIQIRTSKQVYSTDAHVPLLDATLDRREVLITAAADGTLGHIDTLQIGTKEGEIRWWKEGGHGIGQIAGNVSV